MSVLVVSVDVDLRLLGRTYLYCKSLPRGKNHSRCDNRGRPMCTHGRRIRDRLSRIIMYFYTFIVVVAVFGNVKVVIMVKFVAVI
jgi:hypothetical protein